MKNVFITQGGCGTSSLSGVTTNYVNRDVHIHERYPETINDKFLNSKVVYLFANPYDCLLSLARRDRYLLEHAYNIRCPIPIEENKFHQFCRDDRSNFPTGTTEEKLEIYLDFGQDIYDFKDHYERWKILKNKTYSIRFIKYEGLLKYGLSLFNDWWGTDIDESVWKPRMRSSDYSKLDAKLIEKLEFLYKDWFDMYNILPDVEDIVTVEKINE